jgi:PIN domain nuclease of toxin-antitoxin system
MPVVLDASAILAVLKAEDGAEAVRQAMHDADWNADGYAAIASAVNVTEVYEQLGGDEAAAQSFAAIAPLINVIPYAGAQIERTAALRAPTRHLGLSLADRACLALAQITGSSAVTADHAWDEAADVTAVDVIQIR